MKINSCLIFLLPFQLLTANSLFVVDYENYLRKHDVVYLDPDYEGYNAFPLGNGDLGGMLWCHENGITIQLNKIDLYDRPENDLMTLRSAGRVSIDFGVPCYSYTHLSDYEARLSLLNANATIHSETAFVRTKINSWLDVNSNVWIIECDANYREMCASGSEIEIGLERWGSRHFGDWYNSFDKDVSNGLGKTKSRIKGKDIVLTDSFEGGLGFSVACRVLEDVSTAKIINDHKVVFRQNPGANKKFYVLIAMATSEEVDNPTESAIALLDEIENKGVSRVKQEQQKWWNSFWRRSFVHLDNEYDYIENIYYFRRYLMASSSRGKFPVPFNGGLWVWNRDHRQWTVPVHWNTQQSYWGLAEQNDPDLMKPYLNTYFRLMPQAEEHSLNRFDIKNALLWSEVHDFSGKMLHADRGDMKYNYTPASQIAGIFWNYFEFTQDLDCLRDTIYPFLKKSAEFYLQRLKWDSKNNLYDLYPAQPYEHPYTSDLKNPITDRYMIESLFRQCIAAAQLLKKDSKKVKQWNQVIEHLWLPPVLDVPEKGKVFGMAFHPDGEVYPNLETYPKRQFYHFDAHTTMVFPANLLGLDQEGSEYFSIARNVALHHPEDRNAITPGAIVSARLGLGDKVIERLTHAISYLQHFNQGLFYNIDHWNNLSLYKKEVENPKLRTQRDYVFDSRARYNDHYVGQSGLWAKPFIQCGMEPLNILGVAVNEMLLQSHEGKIRVFPAVPANKSMAFSLRARGAFIVSSRIDENRTIPGVEILSLKGNRCHLQNPWSTNDIIVLDSRGRKINYKIDSGNVIVFNTVADEEYTVKRSDEKVCSSVYFFGTPTEKPKKCGEAILGKERSFTR